MRKIFFLVICLNLQHITFTGCLCQLDPPPYGYPVTIDLLDKSTGRIFITKQEKHAVNDLRRLKLIRL